MQPTAELMAGTLAGMDIERAWVVHGAAGWDEATPIGPFLAFDVTRGRGAPPRNRSARIRSARPAVRAILRAAMPRRILRHCIEVFEGRDRGAHLAALALQCGLALVHRRPRGHPLLRASTRREAPWTAAGRGSGCGELREFAASARAHERLLGRHGALERGARGGGLAA